MAIDKYISELLYNYDCVIIPDFGGFITSYASSNIQANKKIITPPSKDIVFNKNLHRNDGLLAHYIAVQENIDYSAALKKIKQWVENSTNSLNEGSKVVLNAIGEFYLDIEQNLQFNADASVNYLPESFGLSTLQIPVIKANSTKPVFKDRTPLPQSAKKTVKRKYAAYAVTLALIALLSWWLPQFHSLKNINYSSFNFFNNHAKSVVNNPIKNISPVETPKQEPLSTQQQAVPDTTLTVSLAKKELVLEQLEQKRFHIIGGCFSVKENAYNYVDKLMHEGFHSSIIDSNHLYRVKYDSYLTREEAYMALAEIKKSNSGAWLLVK